MIQKGQTEAKDYTIDDLVDKVIEGEVDGQKAAKIMMKNGRTLTTLILVDGQWKADTIWFK